MPPQSLSELCIKTTCENIENIVEFLNCSPLPWTLTKEVVKKYSNYRWHYINQIALKDESRHLKCLEFIHLDKIIPMSLRNAILATSGWEVDVFDEDVDHYCVWVNYYNVKHFNLVICKSCFDTIKSAQKKIQRKNTY